MKYIIYSVILLLNLLCLQSCLKEEENIFGQSSAERLIAKSKEIDEVLSSSPYGWYMNYYADSEAKKTGGYQLLCKFEHGKVTMAGAFTLTNKYSKVGVQHSSTYSILHSQGPVLSFSTYNPVIHSFADPGSTFDLDGYAGDFEFVVMEASKDKIVMRGVKHNLKIEMYPFTQETDWSKYCLDVVAFQAKVKNYARFTISESGKNIGMATVVTEDNELINTEEVALEKRMYTVTDNGIDLYEPIKVSNREVNRFVWDKDAEKFIDKDGTNLEMSPVLLNYEQYLGKYEVMADNMDKPVTVTISEKEKDKTLHVSSEFLGYEFDITIVGNRLNIKGQTLGIDENTGHYLKLGVYTTADMLLLTSAGYSFTQPLEGMWYKGPIEKPELNFFATSTSVFIFSSYAWGVRVLEFNKDSTNKNDIVGYKSLIYTNPVFKKL